MSKLPSLEKSLVCHVNPCHKSIVFYLNLYKETGKSRTLYVYIENSSAALNNNQQKDRLN